MDLVSNEQEAPLHPAGQLTSSGTELSFEEALSMALLNGKFVKSIAKIAMTIVEHESSLSKVDSIPQNIYSEISELLETESSIKQNELVGIVFEAVSAIAPIGPIHVDVIMKKCCAKSEL